MIHACKITGVGVPSQFSCTSFSSGRLHQVEYAIEAINSAGTCIGLQSADGVVLAAERRVVSKLLAPSKTSEKTYILDEHMCCLVAGLTADANILVDQARLGSQRSVPSRFIVRCLRCIL